MDFRGSSSSAAVAAPAIGVSPRAAFIVRTYNHLFGAILAFTLIEIGLFRSGLAQTIAETLAGISWLLVLGAFMIVGWLASRTAHRAAGRGAQYLALAAFVVAQALICVPLLYFAELRAPGTIQSAATLTLLGFAGLTAVAFWTRKDFSFLGAILRWVMIVALLAIVGSIVFGFALGTWFSVAMVGAAGAAILYDTSNVIRRFPEDRHVGAALELFGSVALMFWYVVRLFGSRN